MTTDAIASAADLIAHLADYRQALMRLNGAPGALQ